MDNKALRLLPIAALAASTFVSSTVSAGPMIGFDPTGTSTYTAYADLWTNLTDSALAQGFVPGRTVNQGDPGYSTTLTAQTRVAAMTANGTALAPNRDLNFDYELTKVTKINEQVILQTPTNANFGFTTQTFDLDPTTAGFQQLAIYFDALGDGSNAVPGDGANTVRCYGTGATACANDGTLILSASLYYLTSSFALDAQGSPTGTGSFDLRYRIDYVNAAYLDVARDSIIGDKLTGTINIPTQYTPDRMFDGTLTSSGILFKVDSSESFIAQVVPEPASLALMGLALVGVGTASRRRRS